MLTSSTIEYVRKGDLVKGKFSPQATHRYTHTDGRLYDWNAWQNVASYTNYDPWIRWQLYRDGKLVEQSRTFYVQSLTPTSCRSVKFNSTQEGTNPTIYILDGTGTTTPAYRFKNINTYTAGNYQIRLRTCHHTYSAGADYGGEAFYSQAGFQCTGLTSHFQDGGTGCQGSYSTLNTFIIESFTIATPTTGVVKKWSMPTSTQLAIESMNGPLNAIAFLIGVLLGLLVFWHANKSRSGTTKI
jgi:hypothetical protein